MIDINSELVGNISMNNSGSAYFKATDQPKDIYIHKTNTKQALHLDQVKVKIVKGKGRAIEGIVIDVIERFKTKFVGTLQVSEKFAFFVPDSTKMVVDVFIPLKKINGATHGQKVVVEITDWKENKKTPNGKVVKVLGTAGDNDTEIHSIMEEYGLAYEFNEDVIAEAEAISKIITPEEIAKRKDFRNVLTFTIDPKTARDKDDAISYRILGNGNVEVGVHIADVSHYVRPDTDLDREAYQRGTSVYLVDRVVPMLPEHLSNNICSLNDNEDKLCFSAVFELDDQGDIKSEWFGKTIINCDYGLSYEEAQEIIEGGSLVYKSRSLGPTRTTLEHIEYKGIRHLNEIAKVMRAARKVEGSVSFNKQEVSFVLDENNKPIDVKFKLMKDSNKLIEEYMLLANRRVAKFINDKNLPSVNRVHEEPDIDKLTELRTIISEFGYKLNFNTVDELRIALNELLIKIEGSPESNMISSLIIRTMQKAVYSVENLGHFGLAFKDYCHFTSPIRRYSDCLTHRLLYLYLNGKVDVSVSKLGARCVHISKQEKLAQKASRDSIKYKQAEYMSSRIGKVYTGIVCSVTDYGLFVSMPETSCEGMVRLTDIEGDTYVVEPGKYTAKGINTGHSIRLGDDVMVIVRSVDLERKIIDLVLVK